jgi:hypothetical protein
MKKLIEALEFYADQSNYVPRAIISISAIDKDAGEKALDVLNDVEYGEHIALEVLQSIEHVHMDTTDPMHCPICYELSPKHNQDCKLKKAIDYLVS